MWHGMDKGFDVLCKQHIKCSSLLFKRLRSVCSHFRPVNFVSLALLFIVRCSLVCLFSFVAKGIKEEHSDRRSSKMMNFIVNLTPFVVMFLFTRDFLSFVDLMFALGYFFGVYAPVNMANMKNMIMDGCVCVSAAMVQKKKKEYNKLHSNHKRMKISILSNLFGPIYYYEFLFSVSHMHSLMTKFKPIKLTGNKLQVASKSTHHISSQYIKLSESALSSAR